ncbi:hypothetical protein [Levilactobacillus brevis]|uniref:hypothetical protein n=1 Tax=Levilactobacillus brevis TaxID=1580 RepID=UPI0035A29930
MNEDQISMFDVVRLSDGRTGTVVEIYPGWVTLEENPHEHSFPVFDVEISQIIKIIHC